MTVRVLIVNDSATARAALTAALACEPDITVVGTVANGSDALAAVERLAPTVVLMDVVMPGIDGYAATRAIMARAPTAVLIVSSAVNPRETSVALEALRAGALSVVASLPAPSDPSYETQRAALAMLVRSLAEVRVGPRLRPAPAPLPAAPAAADSPAPSPGVDAVGIVASTGGPSVLAEILTALPRGVLPPLLVVQHIAKGFSEGLVHWLASASGHTTQIAEHGVCAARGVVYIAPSERQLGIDAGARLQVTDEPPVGVFRPSGTHLLRSMARALGARAIGVVCTGMGEDGADGAVLLRRAGGRVVAQDEATSVVYGMPRAAYERGGAERLLPPDGIARWICAQTGQRFR